MQQVERPRTVTEWKNHSFNLMVTVVLVFSGIAFGAILFSPVENDWADRFDDIGLPLIGLICLAWFVMGDNRFRRTVIPVVLAGIALVVQALAIPLERDDAAAFGDNIGGLVMYVPFFLFTLIYYLRLGREESPVPASTGGIPPQEPQRLVR